MPVALEQGFAQGQSETFQIKLHSTLSFTFSLSLPPPSHTPHLCILKWTECNYTVTEKERGDTKKDGADHCVRHQQSLLSAHRASKGECKEPGEAGGRESRPSFLAVTHIFSRF